MQHAPQIYIIAGEHSGDQLGAGLMQALKQQSGCNFQGVGGKGMMKQGLTSLFDMQDISVMGFTEIVPHLFRITSRIRQTVQDIIEKKPDILITIDSPGFCFRVIKALRKHNAAPPLCVHYVAQTVWAYKPGRAVKAANLLDGLMTLFAFEVPYFTKHGLNTQWVGHPAAWHVHPKQHTENTINLALFPGSRNAELKRHMPLYRAVCERLASTHPTLQATMPVPENLHALATQLSADWPCPLNIVPSAQKQDVLNHAQAALCKSGTITLECGLSETPMVITYKANPISVWVVRRTVQTQFAGLPNILLEREAVPELIQEKAQPDAIAQALAPLLSETAERTTQKQALHQLRHLLLPSSEKNPSELAAAYVLSRYESGRT